MTSTRPVPTTQPPPSRRSGLLLALIGLVVLLKLAIWGNNVWGMHQPSGGFVIQTQFYGGLVSYPITAEALAVTKQLDAPLTARAINGHELTGELSEPTAAMQLVDTRPGASNRYVFEDRQGRSARFELAAAVPSLRAVYRNSPGLLLSELVSIFYLGLGIVVWWLRPRDRAAVPLLLFSLVATSQMSPAFGFAPLGPAFIALVGMVFPLYGPTLLDLGLKFTGCHERRHLKRLHRISLAAAAAISAGTLAVFLGAPYRDTLLIVLVRATGVMLVANALATVAVSFTASRPPHPLGLRRRARVLAVACLVAFLFPSLSLVLPTLPAEGYFVVVLCLASFPALLAYAIVRHRMFDLRIVLGQGAVYAVLSVGVLLAYLAIVMVGLKAIGRSPEAPHVTGLIVVVLVVLLSLVQLRVQRTVNRWVFRSRYVYADALERASSALARARTRSDVTDTIREALLGAMQLSRACFAVQNAETGWFDCTELGSEPDPQTGERPAALPKSLDPVAIAPVARALRTGRWATASDSVAASAQLAPQTGQRHDGPQAGSEADFWAHYGVEAIVPLTVGRESAQREVVGLLLLGPKLNGRPLDGADQKLIVTLTNQLAVALENSDAFEEIRQLKVGLERQVEQRTRDLMTALEDLKQAQVHLIETEKQAMLGRLVAGIVHEVNSPLGVLRSSADTTARMLGRYREYVQARAQQDDPAARQLLIATAQAKQLATLMNSSSDRINSLVASLKQFVALDAAERQSFDVREGIDSAVTLLSPSFTDRISILRDYADERPRVECYPAKLNQVFVNLLENAANAVEGRGEIKIRVARSNGNIEVEFSDNGKGIPPERLAELFEFGFTEKAGRVGLRMGLAASKRSVQDVGGQISIDSEPGRGTSVRLRLPASAG